MSKDIWVDLAFLKRYIHPGNTGKVLVAMTHTLC